MCRIQALQLIRAKCCADLRHRVRANRVVCITQRTGCTKRLMLCARGSHHLTNMLGLRRIELKELLHVLHANTPPRLHACPRRLLRRGEERRAERDCSCGKNRSERLANAGHGAFLLRSGFRFEHKSHVEGDVLRMSEAHPKDDAGRCPIHRERGLSAPCDCFRMTKELSNASRELQSAKAQRDAIMNYRTDDLAKAFAEGVTLAELKGDPATHLHVLVEETLDFHARRAQALLSDDDNVFLEMVKLLVTHGADPHAALQWKWEPGHEREYEQGETANSLVLHELQTEPSGVRLTILEALRDAFSTQAKP